MPRGRVFSSTSPGAPRRVRATPRGVGVPLTACPAYSSAHYKSVCRTLLERTPGSFQSFTFSAIPPHISRRCADTLRDDCGFFSPSGFGYSCLLQAGFSPSVPGGSLPGERPVFPLPPAGCTQKPVIAMFYGPVCLFLPFRAVRAGLMSDSLDCAFQ